MHNYKKLFVAVSSLALAVGLFPSVAKALPDLALLAKMQMEESFFDSGNEDAALLREDAIRLVSFGGSGRAGSSDGDDDDDDDDDGGDHGDGNDDNDDNGNGDLGNNRGYNGKPRQVLKGNWNAGGDGESALDRRRAGKKRKKCITSYRSRLYKGEHLRFVRYCYRKRPLVKRAVRGGAIAGKPLVRSMSKARFKTHDKRSGRAMSQRRLCHRHVVVVKVRHSRSRYVRKRIRGPMHCHSPKRWRHLRAKRHRTLGHSWMR